MAVWWRLLLVILAAIERTSCRNTFSTEPEYMALGYFKKSQKLLDTLIHHDYQDTVQEIARANRDFQDTIQELARANRDYPDLARGFHRKVSKVLDEEISQDYEQSIDSFSPMIGKRRVRSQKMRREKLNLQGVRSHRAHSLDAGRRRRLQPDPTSKGY
ncbi:uncharacterized protein LOC134750179 [Cydia strobilella]|uniref:uncharacterized protein LOC134750179 n=1 Tax=Cydia strobilella TaxID=1100964 RepID=UPI003003DCC5